MADCFEALEAFPAYHNAQRIHMGRACNGRIPDEAFPELPVLPTLPDVVNPNDWLKVYHGRAFRRQIRANGTIQVDKHTYYVDHKLAKRSVLVHLDADQRCLRVTLDGKSLSKALPLKDLPDGELEIESYLKLLQAEARSIADYRYQRWMQSGEAA